MRGLTLNQTLERLGYHYRRSGPLYQHDILRGGSVVFTGTAGDVWQWLRASGELEQRSDGTLSPIAGLRAVIAAQRAAPDTGSHWQPGDLHVEVLP